MHNVHRSRRGTKLTRACLKCTKQRSLASSPSFNTFSLDPCSRGTALHLRPLLPLHFIRMTTAHILIQTCHHTLKSIRVGYRKAAARRCRARRDRGRWDGVIVAGFRYHQRLERQRRRRTGRKADVWRAGISSPFHSISGQGRWGFRDASACLG